MNSVSRSRIACSKSECQLERQKRSARKQYEKCRDHGHVVNPTGWRKLVVEALEGLEVSVDEEWVENSEAIRIAELTRMRFNYLIMTSALTIRPHPTKVHRVTGNPIRLFSKTEMRVVGETFKAWSKEHRNGM